MNVSDGPVPEDFNAADPAVVECPYAFYSALQKHAPVYHVADGNYYLISTHPLVNKVARAPAIFSSDIRRSMGFPAEIDKLFIPTSALLLADAPLHTRHKSIVVKAFSPLRIKKMHDEVQKIIDDLVLGFIDRGEADFLAEYAAPLPLILIADMLGVPRSYGKQFQVWSDAMVIPLSGASTHEMRRAIAPILKEMNDFFTDTFLEKRQHPTDDIISDLATIKIEPVAGEDQTLPRQLTLEEGQTIIQLLMAGGNESSTSALCSLIEHLATNPELASSLRNNPDLIAPAIEEVLRLESPAQGFWRLVRQDTELAGVSIPKGAMVFCCIGAANRDEQQFSQANQVDLHRKNNSTHLSFGAGTHFCAGVALARMELDLSARTLLKRMDNIRLTPNRPPPRHNFNTISRSLANIHISFEKIG